MQKARRHPEYIGTPTACKHTVSGTISLAFSAFFSPFPHGTSSLSVIQEYLALPDGAGRFTQDFTGPALLRIPPLSPRIHLQDSHLLWWAVPEPFDWFGDSLMWSYYPGRAVTPPVWALPRSLATTWGITVVFFSSAYLDVSVRRVRPPNYFGVSRQAGMGCPIRKSADQRFLAAPHSLSQLCTSFFASVCLGIHRVPFLT